MFRLCLMAIAVVVRFGMNTKIVHFGKFCFIFKAPDSCYLGTGLKKTNTCLTVLKCLMLNKISIYLENTCSAY